jgi:hypothetical protein
MYFLIACNDEPPRSFSDLIALQTISDVGGRFGFAFDDADDDFFVAFFAAGDATSGAAAAAGAATSDIVNNNDY